MLNVRKRLEFYAILKPNQLAFVEGKKEITFAKLHNHTLKIASVLKEFGIKRGDLVGTILPGHLDWPVTLALSIIGATSFSKPNVGNAYSDVKPDWLITSKVDNNFPMNKTLVVDQKFAEQVNLADLYPENNENFDPSQPTRLYSTSGTTGDSKYVGVSENELIARFLAPSSAALIGNGKFVNFFAFPAYQSHNWALRSLFEGRTYFSASPNYENLVKLIADNNVKTVIGSPNHILQFLDTIKAKGAKLESNFNIVMGGSSPTSRILNRIRSEQPCKIYNALAATETGFIAICDVTTEDFPGLLIHPNSIVQILNDEGGEVDFDQSGLIRYKVPFAASSYLNNPTATAKSFDSEFFYSGDIGFKGEDGRLHIIGRNDEIINFGGVKISPEQLDEIATLQIGVQDAATFALEDNSGISKLSIALVVDQEFIEADFRLSISEKFTRTRLVNVFLVSSIPRNINGKILRRELNQKFCNLE